MTTYNIKQAKKAVHPLKRAVMLQFGDSESFYESVPDIANYGASVDRDFLEMRWRRHFRI